LLKVSDISVHSATDVVDDIKRLLLGRLGLPGRVAVGPASTHHGRSTVSSVPARQRLGEMVDPTSDLGEDVDEADAAECEHCGAKIVQSPTHRVVTWVEGGAVESTHFCSAECRDAYDQ
jgi:hypothetical protein